MHNIKEARLRAFLPFMTREESQTLSVFAALIHTTEPETCCAENDGVKNHE